MWYLGIIVPSHCPRACVSRQVTVRWIHHFTATLRYSTEEAVGGYMEKKSTVRNIGRVLQSSIFLRCGLFFEGIRVSYHAWQLTQRSPSGEIPNYPQTIGPILRTASFRAAGSLSSRLYCTGRYDGRSRVLAHKVWWVCCTHAPTPFTSLHCAALRCAARTVCMKESPFGDASLSPRYLQISPFPPSHLLGTTRCVSG